MHTFAEAGFASGCGAVCFELRPLKTYAKCTHFVRISWSWPCMRTLEIAGWDVLSANAAPNYQFVPHPCSLSPRARDTGESRKIGKGPVKLGIDGSGCGEPKARRARPSNPDAQNMNKEMARWGPRGIGNGKRRP